MTGGGIGGQAPQVSLQTPSTAMVEHKSTNVEQSMSSPHGGGGGAGTAAMVYATVEVCETTCLLGSQVLPSVHAIESPIKIEDTVMLCAARDIVLLGVKLTGCTCLNS
jgi:hypothetical protein